jgi:hypothetical protein
LSIKKIASLRYAKLNLLALGASRVRATTIEELEALWREGVTSYIVLQRLTTLVTKSGKTSKKLDRVVSIFSSMTTLQQERARY